MGAFDEFLSGTDEKEAGGFLESDGYPEIPPPRSTPTGGRDPMVQGVTDYGLGATDTLLNTFNIPNSLFNWASGKLGSDFRLPHIRDIDFSIGEFDPQFATSPGEEPDTGSYRAGKYTMEGLEFLAPMLKTGKTLSTGVQMAPTTWRGVSQKVSEPFAKHPWMSTGAEIAAGTASGFGAHYGREEFGWLGEQAGGIIGGFSPQGFKLGVKLFESMPKTPDNLAGWFVDKAYKRIFPYTPEGSRMRAGEIVRGASESGDPVADIMRNKGKTIEGAKISPARMTDDPDQMALEQLVLNENKELDFAFRKNFEYNNELSRQALSDMQTDDSIQQVQRFYENKNANLIGRLDWYMDQKIRQATDAVKGMHPKEARETANKLVRLSLDKALAAARVDENTLWRAVPEDINAMSGPMVTNYKQMMLSRPKNADPRDIPAYVRQYLGSVDKNGNWVAGAIKGREPVRELQAMRSRILQDIRAEKKKDAPNWNRIRVWDDLQDGLLETMKRSRADKTGKLTRALEFSSELNKKFKGGIMSQIFNSKGEGLAPSLTLENLGTGPIGAENARKLITAAPDSKKNIEQVLRAEMLYSLVDLDSGRLRSLSQAKRYLANNDELMGMFPDSKVGLERAIAAEEQARWYKGVHKTRTQKAARGRTARLAKTDKPSQTLLKRIMTEKNPAKAMDREIRRLNAEGKSGLKNDIINMMIGKSQTAEVLDSGHKALSGDKMYNFWTDNRKVLGRVFDSKEQARIDQVVNTLRLAEGRKHLPVDRVGKLLQPQNRLMEYIIRILAVKAQAEVSPVSGAGASIQTANIVSTSAKRFVQGLDVNRAKKLIADAVMDEELWTALAQDATKYEYKPDSKSWRVLQGWMVANSLETVSNHQNITYEPNQSSTEE